MDLDQLRTVQATERSKDSLQHLRDSFYSDVATYIADLRAQREERARQVDDPFSDDGIRRLSDEIEAAEEVAEAIYERRVGKVVKLASFAAADMSVEVEGMTDDERELFDDLVDRIERNKTTVLESLSGGSDDGSDESMVSAGEPLSAEETEAIATPDNGTGNGPANGDEPAHPPPGPAHSDKSPLETDRAGDAAAAPPTGEKPSIDAQSGAGTERQPVPPAAEKGGSKTDENPNSEGVPDSDLLADAMGGESADEGSHTVESATAGTETGGANETGDGESDGTDGDSTDTDSNQLRTDGAVQTTASESGATGSPDTPSTDVNDRIDDQAVGGSDTGNPMDQGGQITRTTVKITENVGSILGVDDREYDLERDDVVTLPSTNAKPLVDRDAAEQLE